MRAFRTRFLVSLLLALGLSGYSSAGVRIRATSENGQGGDENNWKLMGRSRPIVLTSHANKVTLTREVVCAGGSGDPVDGNCASGRYLFIFQLQSTATRITIQIGKLPNLPVDVGVMACDDSNTRELCTVDTNPPSLASLANNINTISTNKTSINFQIPNFPAFPAGSDTEEGQGLTIFIVIQQNGPLPLTYPSVGTGIY